jgi:hypothetical protein
MLEQLAQLATMFESSRLLKQRHSKRTNEAVIEEAGSSIFLVYRKLQQKAV